MDYAEEKEFEIVGESFDDNVSGMHFDRDGIEKIYDVVDGGKVDAIIVKDLSRLGRHRTQTALFIDYLKAKNVRVLSVTENIDTFNEDDDLNIGFEGIINDFYAKDMSRKIRAGYRQKQKEGICTMPPMGYFKDKHTGKIIVMDEPAEIIRQIFHWYIEGYGLKSIAQLLNDRDMKSPSYYQKKYYNKNQGYHKPKLTFKHLWENYSVKRILQNEFYIGTLVCHKEDSNKINKVRKLVPEEEQIRHEDYAPAIISKEIWDEVQFLLTDKPKRNVRAGASKPFHRYTGLLECKDCGFAFVAKRRQWRNRPKRVEYVCGGYHRYGNEHCSPHRIDEETLDTLVHEELKDLKGLAQKNWSQIEADVRKWASHKTNTEKTLKELSEKIQSLELDIENILMERINDKENRATYDVMIEKRKANIADCKEKIYKIQNMDDTLKKRREEMKHNLNLIDQIIADGGISNTHLRMLIDKIQISESEKGLQIKLMLNAPFIWHREIYGENGEVLYGFIDEAIYERIHELE